MKALRINYKVLIIPIVLIIFLLTVFYLESKLISNIPPTWNGYLVASNLTKPAPVVTFVNGSWTVPTLKPAIILSLFFLYDSKQWVGIGSYNNDYNIVQIGTEAYYEGLMKPVVYRAWYEYLPNGIVTLSNFTINPGDIMYASVNCISNCSSNTQFWRIRLNDLTRNESFENTTLFNSSRLYGEWILELRNAFYPSNFLISQTTTYFGNNYTNINSDYATVDNRTGTIGALNYNITSQSETTLVSNLSNNGTSFYIS